MERSKGSDSNRRRRDRDGTGCRVVVSSGGSVAIDSMTMELGFWLELVEWGPRNPRKIEFGFYATKSTKTLSYVVSHGFGGWEPPISVDSVDSAALILTEDEQELPYIEHLGVHANQRLLTNYYY